MAGNSYYADISNEFITHYFKLLTEDTKKIENLYAANCKLQLDSKETVGKAAVHEKILSLKGFSTDDSDTKFVSQPYGKNDILITVEVKIESKPAIASFILHEADEATHRYAVTTILIHKKNNNNKK